MHTFLRKPLHRLIVFILSIFLTLSALAREVVFACVDCFSSASLYSIVARQVAPDVKIKWILIQTHDYLDPAFEKSLDAFPAESLRLRVDPDNDREVQNLLRRLQQEGIRPEGGHRVLGGMDQGTYYASDWNAQLGIKDNSPMTRHLRREKYPMSLAAGEYGIPTLMPRSVEEGLRFMNTFAQNDAVIKFNAGVGGFGLNIVSKKDRPRLTSLLKEDLKGKKGTQGKRDSIIIQPRIVGHEYYIQTFSIDGNTTITGLWRYYKINYNGTHIYFVDRPLSLTSPEARELGPIVSKINHRVGQEFGMAHIEMMKEHGTNKWWLIEVNARVAGSGIPAVEHAIYGMSQLDLFFIALLHPERLQSALATFPRPMEKDAFLFIIPAPYTGTVAAEALAELKKPPYFLPASHYEVKAEKVIPKATQDLMSAAFVLHAVGESAELKPYFSKAFHLLESGQLIKPINECRHLLENLGAFYSTLKQQAAEIPWN